MFGRMVKVDGKEFLVLCCPDTPLWDVLLRAAKMAKEEDEDAQAEHRKQAAAHDLGNRVFG